MSDVMTFSKRTAAGLEEVLRTLLLDSENKVPADRLRIVGALSEGYIIESGSNANGEYIRWADGTQICMCRGEVAQAENSTTGKIFTFPAAFVGASNIRLVCSPAGIVSGSAHATTVVENGVVTTSQYIVKILVPSNNGVMASTSTLGFHAIAIGRWKA